jgi:hypothetical protein
MNACEAWNGRNGKLPGSVDSADLTSESIYKVLKSPQMLPHKKRSIGAVENDLLCIDINSDAGLSDPSQRKWRKVYDNSETEDDIRVLNLNSEEDHDGEEVGEDWDENSDETPDAVDQNVLENQDDGDDNIP